MPEPGVAFDPDFDHAALTREGRGRRIFPSAPEQSLLLRKASAQVPHGGGKRLSPGDGFYEVLLRWIQQGTPRRPAGAPVLERIRVEPATLTLAYHATRPLRVTAHYSDGQSHDVTPLAMFQSNESVLAAVSADGLVQAGPLPGEAAVTARFMEKFAVCSILMP